MNILGLPFWQVLDVSETTHDMQIEARCEVQPSACPHCGCVANLYRHGVKQQRFMDLPIRAKRVGILAHRQRYKCRDCGQTFMQPLPDMDEKRIATRRLIGYIAAQGFRRTFTAIAEEVGLDERTIRNVFSDATPQLEAERVLVTPTKMGTDAPGFRGGDKLLAALQFADAGLHRQDFPAEFFHLGGVAPPQGGHLLRVLGRELILHRVQRLEVLGGQGRNHLAVVRALLGEGALVGLELRNLLPEFLPLDGREAGLIGDPLLLRRLPLLLARQLRRDPVPLDPHLVAQSPRFGQVLVPLGKPPLLILLPRGELVRRQVLVRLRGHLRDPRFQGLAVVPQRDEDRGEGAAQDENADEERHPE